MSEGRSLQKDTFGMASNPLASSITTLYKTPKIKYTQTDTSNLEIEKLKQV